MELLLRRKRLGFQGYESGKRFSLSWAFFHSFCWKQRQTEKNPYSPIVVVIGFLYKFSCSPFSVPKSSWSRESQFCSILVEAFRLSIPSFRLIKDRRPPRIKKDKVHPSSPLPIPFSQKQPKYRLLAMRKAFTARKISCLFHCATLDPLPLNKKETQALRTNLTQGKQRKNPFRHSHSQDSTLFLPNYVSDIDFSLSFFLSVGLANQWDRPGSNSAIHRSLSCPVHSNIFRFDQ